MSSLLPRLTKYIPYPPTVRQQAALYCYDREMLYGGAAGGGKSDWVLMSALQFADFRDYSAIIFRRTFTQLADNGALLELAQEWLGPTDAQGAETINGYPTRWDFPSGAILNFSHMQTLADRFNHQGAAYHFVAFDELTQYFEKQYTYLFSRIRKKKGDPIPLRMRAATNPGGIGADWVQARFEIPNEPIRNLHTSVDGRLFLPARLEDNPHLDHDEYVASLNELDPVTRAQLLAGDWSVRHLGGMIKRGWFEIVDAAPANAQRVRYWDRAATKQKEGTDPDWSVGTLYAKTEIGDTETYYVEHVDRFREESAESIENMKQRAELDGPDIPIRIEIEGGSSGKDAALLMRKALRGYTVTFDRPTGPKPARAGPCATCAKGGEVKLVRGAWVSDWLSEADSFPSGSHDDQIDSWSGAHAYVSQAMSWAALNAPMGEDDPDQPEAP